MFWPAASGDCRWATVPVRFDRDKLPCRDVWEYRTKLFKDLKAHHLNACHFEVPYVAADELDDVVKLADRNGIHFWGVCSYLAMMPPVDKTPKAVLEPIWRGHMQTWERQLTHYRQHADLAGVGNGSKNRTRDHLPYILDARKVLTRSLQRSHN